jgi:RNA polymerase sigma factor (sigma-70 family)
MERGQSVWVQAVIGAYEAKLLRYAGDIVGRVLARDVVQDTFLKLCREPRARIESHLSAWLFTVCRNTALEVKRKVRRLSALDEDGHADERGEPGAQFEHDEALARVQLYLANLPERQRELVRLRFDGELSYKEIAEITGLSVTNVGFLLHTALSQVRRDLEQEASATLRNQARGKR